MVSVVHAECGLCCVWFVLCVVYAECHICVLYAECHNAECRYAGCLGAWVQA